MENPSLRVSGHVSSMNRTFVAEVYAEDDFGHWAMDEITGEQGYVDDERSCFPTWDDNHSTVQEPSVKEEKRKKKGRS